MKRSLKEITDFKLHTKDNSSGNVKDLLFDEKLWIIRYIEADFGNLFTSRRVLIPKAFWEKPDWNEGTVTLPISDSEIDKCPDTHKHRPVSRAYEAELHKYYRVNPYWPIANIGLAGRLYPPRPIAIPNKVIEEKNIESVLRSFEEIRGYELQALDGKIGHIDDLLVDADDWQLVYVIVDTSNWNLWSKKVMIPIFSLHNINYVNREVTIDMSIETIKNAPKYNPSEPLTREQEEGVYDFFSISLVK
jgi:hypothetical protein